MHGVLPPLFCRDRFIMHVEAMEEDTTFEYHLQVRAMTDHEFIL